MRMKNILFFALFLLGAQCLHAQPINRKAVVLRHTVLNTTVDSLSALSVGNGNFAFTVDVTGLQSFPEKYAKGVALGTQSIWGWHSFVDTANYRYEETLKNYEQQGRKVSYSVQLKQPERNKNAVNWFRLNPHRLQLGNLGLDITLKDGSLASIHDIKNIHQTLNLYTGEIISKFTVENIPVQITTICHQQKDIIGIKIVSSLLLEKRIKLKLVFPYPTAEFKDAATNYKEQDKHQSAFVEQKGGINFSHAIDTSKYFVSFSGHYAKVNQAMPHYFLIEPILKDSFECSFEFAQKLTDVILPFSQIQHNSQSLWKQFWQSVAAIDFAGSIDPRANELERRVILSEYLTKIQCSNAYPPQETGLTYNSWYGKPHLEMHWWHAYHYALWGRVDLMEKSLAWYARVFNQAKAIATRQGYEGVRWQKMTDNQGRETPSSVGALLIWQQPHVISFAELCYRNYHNQQTLEKYKDLVFATADFMASFAYYDAVKGRYQLGKNVIPAQERFKAEETFNPTYELAYWHWALAIAQQWRVRLHLPRNNKWDDILQKLSPLPIQDQKYLFTESGTDSYTNPEYKTDHPSVLGALGMLPKSEMVDTLIMQNTFNWIWNNWSWKDTWGWDFPMVAMTATRLGMPDKAIDALLMPIRTNTYLNNGHNYQDDRLTIYLPGNGGLLTAIAMMCAGYDGCKTIHPGIPANGKWKVKFEGFHRMP